jgi:hypothetical protein
VKGFILRTQLVREEDLIVEVLTPTHRLTLYRFYGARHPQLQKGYLIDFYPETPKNYPILRLRHPIHLPLGFELSPRHLYWWQRFIGGVEGVTRGAGPVDSRYFQLLERVGRQLIDRPPVRGVGEGVVELLRLEGKLPSRLGGHCLRCGGELGEWVTLSWEGGPLCRRCGRQIPPLRWEGGKVLVEEGRSLLLSELELERWLEGLLPRLSYNFPAKREPLF